MSRRTIQRQNVVWGLGNMPTGTAGDKGGKKMNWKTMERGERQAGWREAQVQGWVVPTLDADLWAQSPS